MPIFEELKKRRIFQWVVCGVGLLYLLVQMCVILLWRDAANGRVVFVIATVMAAIVLAGEIAACVYSHGRGWKEWLFVAIAVAYSPILYFVFHACYL